MGTDDVIIKGTMVLIWASIFTHHTTALTVYHPAQVAVALEEMDPCEFLHVADIPEFHTTSGENPVASKIK